LAITEALRLVIDADTRGAVRGVEQLGKTTERELSRSEKSLDRWGRGLTNVGAGMIGLGSVALVGLGAAAKASEEAHLSVVKLENTIANMPMLAGESSKSFIDLADSIQDVTAADADAIVEAEALLGTFNLTGREIRGITPLVVDYARKFGLDIPSAAIQVGKALDGSIGALKRNGVSIDEAAFATDRYAAVQEALSEQVGGFAEAEGKTFAGSIERMKNELGDLAEGVGVGAVDAFSSMFGVVDGLTSRFNELSPATQSAIGKFATFGAVGLIAAGGVSVVIGQIIRMRDNFSLAGDAVRGLVTHLGGVGGAARMAASAAGLAGLAFAAGQLGDELADMIHPIDISDLNKLERDLLALGQGASQGAELVGLAGDDWDKLADSMRRVADPSNASRLRDAAAALPFGGGENRDLEQARQKIDDIDKALVQLSNRDPDAAAASFNALIDALEEQGISADTAKGLLNDYDSALASIETGEAVAGSEELSGSLTDQADATEDAKTALQEYSDELRAMTDPLFGAMDAITGNRDAQLGYQDALAGVLEAQVALDDAIAEHGPNSAEAAEAARGLGDAQRAVTDAQWATVESAAEVDSALAALTDAVDSGDVSMESFRGTLATWVAQGFLTQAQADAAAASVFGLAGEAEEANRKRVSIPVATPGSEESRIRLRGVRDQAHDIPGHVNTNVATSGVGTALSLLDAVKIRIQQLDGSTAEVRVNARATSTGRIGGVPIFHEGGIVPGPRGQELLALVQAGEHITSLTDMDAMGRAMPASGVGAGSTYVDNRTINIQTGADPQQVVEALKRYERNNGSGWRAA